MGGGEGKSAWRVNKILMWPFFSFLSFSFQMPSIVLFLLILGHLTANDVEAKVAIKGKKKLWEVRAQT